MRLQRSLMACALAAAVASPGRALGETLVLLPFENLSGTSGAHGQLESLVAFAIQAKGYHVERGEGVEEILESERVRYLDSLAAAPRNQLLQQFGARGLVQGAIYTYADGDNPMLALSARVLREDGGIAWWGMIGLAASDTEGMFGLGRAASMDALVRSAVARLVADLPAPGAQARSESLRGKPLGLSAPRTYRSAALGKGSVHRICLLPFDNPTPARDAPRALEQLLWRRLAQSGSFEVVEPSELRAAVVAERIPSLRSTDATQLQRLGSRLGTKLFLHGALTRYSDASPRGGRVEPEVALDLALVDVDAGRVLWTSEHARKGKDYESLFQRGAISNAMALGDRMLSEMIDAVEKTTPKKGR